MTPSPVINKIQSLTATTPKANVQKTPFILSVDKASDSSESNSPQDPSKLSQCSSLSDGEAFECFGENDHLSSTMEPEKTVPSVASGVDLELAPHLPGDSEKNPFNRNTWARSSSGIRGLRGSMKRPLGSNVLASHLYRSSSFNSSGRSSNCDTTEDLYSDMSLEDVHDLNHKLESLQRQITNLADTQMTTDDRTTRAKTEYAVLQTKYHMLEEQLRETELRSEERLSEEQKRYRELLSRFERESELKIENYQIRLQTVEGENLVLRDDVQRLKNQCDKQSSELAANEEKLETARYNLTVAQENLIEARTHEKRYLTEKNHSEQMIMELHKEIERIRTEAQAVMATVKKSNGFHHQVSYESTSSLESLRIEEIQNELDDLKIQNRQLQEANEELQALLLSKNIEEGRNLLNGGTSNLADELKEMGPSQDEAIMSSLSQLQDAYQDKDDECRRLKRYIDTILLNIVENHPQLLEIKTSSEQ